MVFRLTVAVPVFDEEDLPRPCLDPVTYHDVAGAALADWGDGAIRRLWSRPPAGRMNWIFGANMAIRAGAWPAGGTDPPRV